MIALIIELISDHVPSGEERCSKGPFEETPVWKLGQGDMTWDCDSKIFSLLTSIVCTCSLGSSTSGRLKAYLKAPRFLLCSVGKSITLRKKISS